MDARFVREPAEKRSEPLLGLGRVEGEELLELVDDDEGLVVISPPARQKVESRLAVLEGRELAERLRVVRELRAQRPAELPQRGDARRRHDGGPALRPRGHHARADEGRLARSGGPDHREKFPLAQPFPERLDLLLASEEAPRVRFGEGGKARIRALLLDLAQCRGRASALENHPESQRHVTCRLETVIPLFRQAPADDPLDGRARAPAA